MRVWAEPGSRGNGGGVSVNVTCAASADGTSCAGALSPMPAGWGSRLSAVALLYNDPQFRLPKSRPKTPTTPAGDKGVCVDSTHALPVREAPAASRAG